MNAEKKKMIFILGGFVGVLILIIAIVCIFFLFQNHTLTYTQIEDKLKSSAIKYYEDHKDLLPQDDGDEERIEASTLIHEELLDSFADMTGDEDTLCSGYVVVSNVRGTYVYTPYLECGEDYKTETLAEHILKTTGEISSDYSGLYEWNGEHVFRGERPSNITYIGGKLWRIVKVDNNGEVVLIYADSIDSKDDIIAWDNRFNNETQDNSGINDYERSRVRSYLLNYYDKKFTDSMKSNIVTYDICIGKRNYDVTVFDGTAECSTTFSDPIGLLPVYDYYNVSLDTSCAPGEYSCQNYNYMSRVFSRNWWTATANTLNTYWVYQVKNGIAHAETASLVADIRPVIHLNRNFIYKGGSGTGDDPYVIE